MLTRYQYGCLQKMKRKDGIERWQFRWQQRSPDGRIRERKITFGSVNDFPERSKALEEKLAELRFDINAERPTKLNSITMARTIQHYVERELAEDRRGGLLQRGVARGWFSTGGFFPAGVRTCSKTSRPWPWRTGWTA